MNNPQYGCCKIVAYTPNLDLPITEYRSALRDTWVTIGDTALIEGVSRRFPSVKDAKEYAKQHKL